MTSGETGPSDLDISDRLRITELYARYTHAYDEGRADELAALFTADGEFVRPGAEPVRGRAGLAEMVRASAARRAGARHVVSAIVVEAGERPDEAGGRAYVQLVRVTDPVHLVVMGRYDDRFARDDGRWRIRSRRFTPFPSAAPAGD